MEGCSSFSRRAIQLITCDGLEISLPIFRAHTVGTPSNSPARHTMAAHTKISSAFLRDGSAAFILLMSALATSNSAGVGRTMLDEAARVGRTMSRHRGQPRPDIDRLSGEGRDFYGA